MEEKVIYVGRGSDTGRAIYAAVLGLAAGCATSGREAARIREAVSRYGELEQRQKLAEEAADSTPGYQPPSQDAPPVSITQEAGPVASGPDTTGLATDIGKGLAGAGNVAVDTTRNLQEGLEGLDPNRPPDEPAEITQYPVDGSTAVPEVGQSPETPLGDQQAFENQVDKMLDATKSLAGIGKQLVTQEVQPTGETYRNTADGFWGNVATGGIVIGVVLGVSYLVRRRERR